MPLWKITEKRPPKFKQLILLKSGVPKMTDSRHGSDGQGRLGGVIESEYQYGSR